MEFKSDKKTAGTWVLATTKTQSSAITTTGKDKGSDFKINTLISCTCKGNPQISE